MIEARIVKINKVELTKSGRFYELVYKSNGVEKGVELFFDRNNLEAGDMILI